MKFLLFLVLGADICKGSRESYTSLVNNSLVLFCFTIKFSEFFMLTGLSTVIQLLNSACTLCLQYVTS